MEEALAAYRQLRSQNPGDPAVAQLRLSRAGHLLLDQKRNAAALALLRLNTEFYPASPEAWSNLAEACDRTGDREGALRHYRKTLELAPAEGFSPARVEARDRLRRLQK